MKRKEQFERKYGKDAGKVLSSISKVAHAGRRLANARAKHRANKPTK